MRARGGHIEQSLNVVLGLARNSNNRVSHFQRRLYNPKRKIVATGELFALPGSKRLQRVDCDHEGNSVILFRQDPAEVAVPSVTVHEIGIDVGSIEVGAPPHGAENGAQRLWATEF